MLLKGSRSFCVFRLKLKPITASVPPDSGSESVIGPSVLLSLLPHQQHLSPDVSATVRIPRTGLSAQLKRPRHTDSDDKGSEVKYLTCLPVLIRQRQRRLMQRLEVFIYLLIFSSERPLSVPLSHLRRPSGGTPVSSNLASAELLPSSWCISAHVCVVGFF